MKRVMTRRVSSWTSLAQLEVRMARLDLVDEAVDEGHGADRLDGEQAGAQAVVDIVGVVGDVVGERRRLRLEAGVRLEVERCLAS